MTKIVHNCNLGGTIAVMELEPGFLKEMSKRFLKISNHYQANNLPTLHVKKAEIDKSLLKSARVNLVKG